MISSCPKFVNKVSTIYENVTYKHRITATKLQFVITMQTTEKVETYALYKYCIRRSRTLDTGNSSK